MYSFNAFERVVEYPENVIACTDEIDYPRISFTSMRIVGGKQIMAELKKIEYVDYSARKMGVMFIHTTDIVLLWKRGRKSYSFPARNQI